MKDNRPLDKNGNPYNPLTEAQMKAARNRPYPQEVTRLTAMLRAREEQLKQREAE